MRRILSFFPVSHPGSSILGRVDGALVDGELAGSFAVASSPSATCSGGGADVCTLIIVAKEQHGRVLHTLLPDNSSCR